MTERHMIAYALIALLLVAAAAVIAWNVYHSHRHAYPRRMKRERAAEASRLADRARDEA